MFKLHWKLQKLSIIQSFFGTQLHVKVKFLYCIQAKYTLQFTPVVYMLFNSASFTMISRVHMCIMCTSVNLLSLLTINLLFIALSSSLLQLQAREKRTKKRRLTVNCWGLYFMCTPYAVSLSIKQDYQWW